MVSIRRSEIAILKRMDRKKMKRTDIQEFTIRPPIFPEGIERVDIKTNMPITEKIFYWRGRPYIVGDKLEWNGYLYEMELIPMQNETAFHIHKYYNGVCYLCGNYSE